MKLYTHAQRSVQSHYKTLLEYSKKRYVKESMIALAVIALTIFGYLAFSWYQHRQNRQAFAGLVEISKSYEAALEKAKEQESLPLEDQKENPWADTQILLEAIASANSGSSLSPFFVMYQAQLALDAEGDYDKACQLMEKGIRRLSKKSPYYDMFNMKRIKMLLDSPQEQARMEALKELEQIVTQKENYYMQEALWTLGSFHAFYGNMPQAIAAWKVLAQEEQSEKTLISSPWVTQAQEKLKTLNISL
ncbi:MAG: hypothetical protein JO129_03860 [Candidatus Dependentiae bacterium]|nr:hypothetical protein [Candidatus Dependentiae bacterium]